MSVAYIASVMSVVGILAVRLVRDWLVVVSATPFQKACAEFAGVVASAAKKSPVNVTESVGAPTRLSFGETLVSTGTRFKTVIVSVFDAPTLGAGLSRVMVNAPAVVSKDAGMVILAAPAPVTDVESALAPASPLFHVATAPEIKFAPVNVSVCASEYPAIIVAERADKLGYGFCTVKFTGEDCPREGCGLRTTTERVPAPP